MTLRRQKPTTAPSFTNWRSGGAVVVPTPHLWRSSSELRRGLEVGLLRGECSRKVGLPKGQPRMVESSWRKVRRPVELLGRMCAMVCHAFAARVQGLGTCKTTAKACRTASDRLFLVGFTPCRDRALAKHVRQMPSHPLSTKTCVGSSSLSKHNPHVGRLRMLSRWFCTEAVSAHAPRKHGTRRMCVGLTIPLRTSTHALLRQGQTSRPVG